MTLVASVVVAGCDDRESVSLVSSDPTAGDYAVHFDATTLDLTLVRGAEPLLVFPKDGFALGVVGAIDDKLSYDPTGLFTEVPLFSPPEDLTWLTPTAAKVLSHDRDRVQIDLTFGTSKHAALDVWLTDADRKRPGRFRAKLSPSPEGEVVAYIKLRPRVDANEGFYGLGESFDSVNQRGKTRAMHIVPEAVESSYNDAHVPVPLLIGTRGWGLLVESYRAGVFAPGVVDADRADVVFGTGNASNDGLIFDLFAATHPLDITAHYYDLTGFPHRPGRWALGPWIWRNENIDQAQVENDAETLRSLDLATTALWIDRPYATGVQTFDFASSNYPDPKGMIDHLHALGLRVAVWHSPYLDENDSSTQALRDEATNAGYYPSQNALLFNKWGKPIDLTNPDAVAWWQQHLAAYRALGIEGYKLDYGEDVVPGYGNARAPWKFADGSDERTMHAEFQLRYHETYAATVNEGESFLICRAGRLGDQKNVDVIWPGDLDATFARRGDVIESADGKYTSVGGLPASVIAGLSLGPSGFPLFGADTGGYRHAPPDRELFMRWFEQTALSTVMQVGTASSDVPWEPTVENGFDASMLDVYREYARLHLRLFPYVYSYLDRLYTDGRAIQRPLGLAFPSMGVHPDDTYMLGDALLVSPVVDRGAVTKAVWFPPGRWAGWFDGAIREGGSQALNEAAPLDRLPLFQREGSIVPMLRPSIDAIAPTTSIDRVDSIATSVGRLYARVFAGGESSFVLYDRTVLTQRRDGTTITVGMTSGDEFTQGVEVMLVGLEGEVVSVRDELGDIPQILDTTAFDATSRGWTRATAPFANVSLRVTGAATSVIVQTTK